MSSDQYPKNWILHCVCCAFWQWLRVERGSNWNKKGFNRLSTSRTLPRPNLKDFNLDQDIRPTYFFLPITLRVHMNPGGEHVIILRPTFIRTFEFMRLPVDVAHQIADLLDQAANNASTTPVVSGQVGKVNRDTVRRFGKARTRIRLSVARPNSVRFSILRTINEGGKSGYRNTPTLVASEARRFANALRQANSV